MNQDSQDKLRDLFSQIKSDSPSMSFETNLMQRLRNEHKVAIRRQRRLAIYTMIVGVLGAIFVPSLVLHLLGWSIIDVFFNNNVSFFSALVDQKIDPMVLSISIVCLVLLIVDTLIRRFIRKKEEEN